MKWIIFGFTCLTVQILLPLLSLEILQVKFLQIPIKAWLVYLGAWGIGFAMLMHYKTSLAQKTNNIDKSLQ